MPFRESLRVTEGIAGVWHYHLAETGSWRALCGRNVMSTHIPLDAWGKGGNPELHESWCRECATKGERDG